MAFLPKFHTEFSEKHYWDKFFVKRGNEAFEWYGEYPHLCDVLHKYMKPTDQTLVIGCGNSKLSPDLYDVGFRKLTNIDISDVVIKNMISQHSAVRPEMTWRTMDTRQMLFEDNQFNVVIDKGTLDALMTEDSIEVRKDVKRMLTEISRVLKMGGRYICVSLLQSHILNLILSWFGDEGWLLRIHRCQEAEAANENSDRVVFPVFVIVLTKLRKLPNMVPVLELCLTGDKVDRVASKEAVLEAINAVQQFAFVRHSLHKGNFVSEQLFLELFSPGSQESRYRLYVVDNKKKTRTKFAIFIVPSGREAEWLFSTPEGRQRLAETSECQRLVVVHLSRNHDYENLEAVKSELSERVLELAPKDLPAHTLIQFWSVGNDLGKRETVKQGKSSFSGDFIVEDVEIENQTLFRRLIFLSNQNVVQSEAKLKTVSNKKKKGKKSLVVDYSFLACDHHKVMVSGLALVPDSGEKETSVLVIGLGGGSLPMFIHRHFPQVNVDVVDIDPEIVKVASECFGFIEDPRMKVHVDDGCEFLRNAAKQGRKFDAVMLDVDSKDTSIGMSCPPVQFLETVVLEAIKSSLQPAGVLVLNLVCRDSKLKEQVIGDLHKVFPTLYSSNVEDEVNEIFYCLPSSDWKKQIPSHMKPALDAMNKDIVRKSNQSTTLETELISKLKIR